MKNKAKTIGGVSGGIAAAAAAVALAKKRQYPQDRQS